MAGQGPAPKHPDHRARKAKDPHPFRTILAEPVPQPALPPSYVVATKDGPERFDWPTRTVEWWAMWRDSPLAAEFTATDWSELLDTALLHAQFWNGKMSLAAELRLRVAKFGATPEDRARLRITFAAANEADDKLGTRQSSSRGTYDGLRLAE